MTKPELEALCKRLSKENDFCESIIYEIKKVMVSAAEIFSKGLAEESQFNSGIQHALDVVSSIINSKVQETSYLHCPSFKNIVEEEQKPAFTVIEGGLSKKNKEVLN